MLQRSVLRSCTPIGPVKGLRVLCMHGNRSAVRLPHLRRRARERFSFSPVTISTTVEVTATSSTASWWVTSDSSNDDKVMIAVENACSLVHLQVIISQYESQFQVQHWLTAVLRLPELISADGEYDSFTQVQRLLLSFESRTFSALGSFSPRHLIAIISTYAQLSYTPSQRWLTFAVAQLLPRLDTIAADPSDLCALISGLAKLQYADCACWQQMYNATLPIVPQLGSQQVATLAMALATIACDNSVLMSALSAKVAEDLSHLSCAEVTQLATSFASIGERSPQFWAAIGDVTAPKLSQFAPAEVAALVRAFATAGQYHRALFNGVAAKVLRELRLSTWTAAESWRAFDVSALGDILWAFKSLRVHNVALLTAIVRYVGAKAAGMRSGSILNEDLKRWVAFVQKQHSDYFMYGFFLSVATGVVLDQMLGATVSFVAAWWLLLRPMITDAAATAYVQFLTKRSPWGGVWASILFNVEDAFRSPLQESRL